MKRINDLPEDIKALAVNNIKKQHNPFADIIIHHNTTLSICFVWNNTPEGHNYWQGVANGTITELPDAQNSDIK